MKSAQKILTRTVLALPLAIAVHTTAATAQTVPTQPEPKTGCISGTPNGMYQGDRPITRYEFAAGMNACLDQVNQQLQFSRANFATRTDFDTLLQRQRELNEQLRELSDRVGTISGDESTAK
ncbi:S-layer homology domain-containing protein [Phormidium sp. FACHB-592]|uniref:S-layer homology domain-containing protein n=1 Tax=Stenomitos frigidus AS-A4 TaxID=2933935 RepID=A0ABV0KCG3_9CYAN|nr:S-layer homology domain-containing protein [Phormidium sp. FACHB-592]MBD2077543.1 S-layer homology domain-containing protein [Phormidium sp. FACHB-592]